MKKKTQSWTVVIVLLIVLWPVGLYFLVQKLRYDKTATFKSTKGIKGVAIFLLVFGGMAFMMTLTGQMTQTVDGVKVPASFGYNVFSICLASLFLVGGVLVWMKADKNAKEAVVYRQYIDFVINSHITFIQELSSRMNKPVDTITKDLEEMISKGFFQDAFIDYSQYQIVLTEVKYNPDNGMEMKKVEMICPGCGARNEAYPGTNAHCEYCGTILK